MVAERLIGDLSTAGIDDFEPVGGQARQLGWNWKTTATGKRITNGYVRIPPGVTQFVTGSKYQIWKRAVPVSASSQLLSIEIGGGIVSGAAGSEQVVPGVGAAAIDLVANDFYFCTVYQPGSDPGDYWFQAGFGNPSGPTLSGNCIFKNGAADTVPPDDEFFTNGAFAVDVEIDDISTEINATLDLTLPTLQLAADAAAIASASIDLTLPPLDVSATAETLVSASLDLVTPPLTLDTSAATEVSATVALTVPPLRLDLNAGAPVPGNPDRMWAPILTALRDCLCFELSKTLWGPPCSCLLVRRNTPIGDCTPGTVPVAPPPLSQQGGNGVAWVRKTDVTPVVSTVAGDRCVNQLVATIELGIVRCIDVAADGSLGDPATLADEALKFESDDNALRRVGRCCTLPGEPQVTLARWQPIFGGGCAGGVQLITVTAKIV